MVAVAEDSPALFLEWKIGPDMYGQLPPHLLDAAGVPDEEAVRTAVEEANELRRQRRGEFYRAIAATEPDTGRAMLQSVLNETRLAGYLRSMGLPVSEDAWLGRVRVLAERDALPDVVVDHFSPPTEAEGILSYVELSANPRDFTPRETPAPEGRLRALADRLMAPLPDRAADETDEAASAIRRALDEGSESVHVTDKVMGFVFGDSEDSLRAALGDGYVVEPHMQKWPNYTDGREDQRIQFGCDVRKAD